MPGIYDLFRLAAAGVERVPWNSRLLAGAGGGALYGALLGDRDKPFMERISKGAVVGLGLGLGTPELLRGAGLVASGGTRVSKAALTGKFNAIKREGFGAFMHPGTLMLGGAAVGAAIAPEGHRSQGAMLGASLGFGFIPGRAIYRGYEHLGVLPGAKPAALVAAGSGAVIAGSIFGSPAAESSGTVMADVDGPIDYRPISDNMRDRMMAMNASGDLVLGLNGRKHG